MGPRRLLGMSRTPFMLKNDTSSTLKGGISEPIRHEISKPTNCLILQQVSHGSSTFTSPAPLFCIKFPWNFHTIFDLFSFSLKTLFLWPSWRYLAHKGHDLYFLFRKWLPKLVHFGVLLIRVFILSPTLRPKTPKIKQNLIFNDLGWILDPFGMDFDRLWKDFWWI